MAGDVNLFFTLDEEEGGRQAAEIEVMVAEQGSRGKGIAKEALRALMAYASRCGARWRRSSAASSLGLGPGRGCILVAAGQR